MQAAFKNFTTFLQEKDAAVEGQQNSYSVEIFSAIDGNSPFIYHHTGANLATFNSTGVKKVDGNSVYRIGSLTKLFTAYTFLVNDGDIHWNTPVTQYVSELREIAAARDGDATTKVSWHDITLGALANHMAGIAADNTLMGELTQSVSNISDLIAQGFPPLPNSDVPNCGTWPECDRQQFFSTFSRMQPAFAPYATAAYSNVAYQILAYALENITGKTYEDMLNDVMKKLDLTNTYYNAPNDTKGIIPGTVDSTHWYYSLGEENPAGNMYSTSSDIAKFGRAIMSYKLLSGPQTRRWMKPSELDTDKKAAIGAPWGIRRIYLNQKNRIVDTYDKGGQISSWTSFMINVPDYDVGFIVLVAGNDVNGLQIEFSDAFGDIIVPALEATARDQAGQMYAGDYVWSSSDIATNATLKSRAADFIVGNGTLNGAVAGANSSTGKSTYNTSAPLNSSMTIVIDDKPGLGITKWVSNGTDMILTVAQLMTNYSDPFWVNTSIRLYPTDLVVTSNGNRKQSFKAMFEDLNAALVDKTYSTSCTTWIGPTAYVYGSLALDQFFLTTESSGAVTVQPQALRVTLKRSGKGPKKRKANSANA